MNTTTQKKVFLAFNIDRVFKSIFLSDDDPKKELLTSLLEEILEKKVTNLRVQTNELNVHHKNERNKRLDLVANADGKKINVELNTSSDTATKIRNLNYYFSFCSQKARIRNSYDIDSEFIHISLNYNMRKDEPLISCYYLYDPVNNRHFDKRYKYFIINLEKMSKCWYDNNSEEVEKRPILTMLGIKEKEDLEKYAKESMSHFVKESVKKLANLNEDTDFVYQYSPAEDDELISNTRLYEAKKDGMSEGIEIGEARGETRGIEIGEARGIEIGQKEQAIQTAKTMLARNYSLEEISIITNLTKEELMNLK